MNQAQHNQIVGFIWSIADDVLRDVYTRGKYRDIILPFTVLRRLDALLEPTKDKVLEMHQKLNQMKIDNQIPQLKKVSGYVFYNTSPFTFKKLLNEPSNIRRNLENYLDGFSSNVQDIISKFKLRNQLDKAEFRRNSTGFIDSRLRLYSDKFFGIFSFVPPLKEQNAIVEHINIQSEKINRFIATKRRFIELLKEQRQGIIDHAVSKGINLKIDLKDTRTCLGNIPCHWEVRRLKTISNIRAQPHLNKEELENIKIPFPSNEEQSGIVELIKSETATIDKAIAKAEYEIEFIREYKEAMKAEAVTGNFKIDN